MSPLPSVISRNPIIYRLGSNVSVHRTAHLVRCTVQRLVGAFVFPALCSFYKSRTLGEIRILIYLVRIFEALTESEEKTDSANYRDNDDPLEGAGCRPIA